MSWQFSKYENPDRWRIGGLILVVQPTIEQLDAMKRVRWRRVKAQQEAAHETIERQERERRRETVRQNQENNKLRRREQFERITAYLRTCEQGITVEQIADAYDVSCREIRQAVTKAKRQGWLIEDANRTHALIRGQFKVRTP